MRRVGFTAVTFAVAFLAMAKNGYAEPLPFTDPQWTVTFSKQGDKPHHWMAFGEQAQAYEEKTGLNKNEAVARAQAWLNGKCCEPMARVDFHRVFEIPQGKTYVITVTGVLGGKLRITDPDTDKASVEANFKVWVWDIHQETWNELLTTKEEDFGRKVPEPNSLDVQQPVTKTVDVGGPARCKLSGWLKASASTTGAGSEDPVAESLFADSFTVEGSFVEPIPEPSSLTLAGLAALIALIGYARARLRQRS